MEFMEELDRITKIEPQDLTIFEVGFLKARSSYLTGEQYRKYQSVLEPVRTQEPEKVLKSKKV